MHTKHEERISSVCPCGIKMYTLTLSEGNAILYKTFIFYKVIIIIFSGPHRCTQQDDFQCLSILRKNDVVL